MTSLDESLLRDLVSAAFAGDGEAVAILLARGIPVDRVDRHSGWSPLHAAGMHARTEVLRVLLRHCEDPDRPRVLGGTALAYVVHELGEPSSPSTERADLLEALGILLAAGADPTCGGSDQSPLELARLYALADVEDLLTRSVRKPR